MPKRPAQSTAGRIALSDRNADEIYELVPVGIEALGFE